LRAHLAALAAHAGAIALRLVDLKRVERADQVAPPHAVRVAEQEQDVAPLGLAMATMQDSHVNFDQNGAAELTPPRQAILVRGAETLTVMTPYLPDGERAQRLNALRLGEIEAS
jgi:hypothetical protein